MRNPGWRVKGGVNAVATPSGDDAATTRLGVLLDDLAEVANWRARLDDLNGLVEALTRRLDDFDRVGVRFSLVAYIVGLVEIGMIALVVN